MDGNTFEKKYNTLGLDLIKTHKMFCQEVLKLLPGQMAVISNGRVRKKLSLSIFFRIFLLWELQFQTKENALCLFPIYSDSCWRMVWMFALLFYFVLLLICSLAPFHWSYVRVIPTAILEFIWQNSQNGLVSDLLFVMFKKNFWSWSWLYFTM